MGASGSGKSTLLAVLSGRASYGHFSGTLLMSGRPAGNLRSIRRVFGFVPQDDVLHGELSVEENIAFHAALRLPLGTTLAEQRRHTRRVAKDLGLLEKMQSRVGTAEQRGLSGGQRKRVSIAMEMVSQPLLLFADEPTSGLDSTTSHEVVRSLCSAASRLGTTVLTVIHQPRFETLCLFDDLLLLAGGGYVVYAGPTEKVVSYFQEHLKVEFPPNSNPADALLDAIQPPAPYVEGTVAADVWSARSEWHSGVDVVRSHAHFRRTPIPFMEALLIHIDRSLLLTMRAYNSILVNQCLSVGAVGLLCVVITYNRVDQYFLQSGLASLLLMLLQGVAAQRVFGDDLGVTFREALVGMPMVSYFLAKDFAALSEVSLSAAVFTATYGAFSGAQQDFKAIISGSWAFVYTVTGLSYIWSITQSPGSAQMTCVVSAFVSFCVSGVYSPELPQLAALFGGRGWMVPALSPIRWLWGYMLTNEAKVLNKLTKQNGASAFKLRGYDLDKLTECQSLLVSTDSSTLTMKDAWIDNNGWVCSVSELLLLGVMFRFLAAVCLLMRVNSQSTGFSEFFVHSAQSGGKLAGMLFTALMISFVLLCLFAEVWVFGILRLQGVFNEHFAM